MQIDEIPNPFHDVKELKPIIEVQNIYVPDIDNPNISRRNGGVWVACGSGGSGKSSLILSMFKSKLYYRNKFDNIFYICPSVSFNSVKNHPFAEHDKVYHELTIPVLKDIYDSLADDTPKVIKSKEKKNRKKPQFEQIDSEDDAEEEEEKEPEYSCLILDDFADALKQKEIQKFLSKMLIKSRHLKLHIIITLQSWKYLPLMLRKQTTFMSCWKPKSMTEWFAVADEVFNLKKEHALQMYNYVFDEDYAHLDVDCVQNKYFKNFNELKITEKI